MGGLDTPPLAAGIFIHETQIFLQMTFGIPDVALLTKAFDDGWLRGRTRKRATILRSREDSFDSLRCGDHGRSRLMFEQQVSASR